MIEAYHKITDFCNRRGKDPVIRNHAFCMYIETLSQALASHENPTPMRMETTSAALLTEQAIEGYVSRAETLVDNITVAVVNPYIRKRTTQDFWLAVASSVVGSFLFALGLALVFWLAKDQIRAWLQTLSE
ncbi:hypothetical protein [Candidatus Entotheonella palauensis]|uniref:Uncharacterized protein n=1 Tax=Candidatus Entotheonella gemina TaxID=1429439 RepID=W4M8C9_9BACT|nr:hypothetical protein [Candidatus Entotheonella palauensis]ETX06455.1 MAG: hypothetical protein ETSY2_16965 [Candidatus Entotheonella gemina]